MRWRSRVLGVVVLGLACAGALALLDGGGSAWSWSLVGVVGLAALVACLANFGDRFDTDDAGISYVNTLTGRLGWPRPRRAAWAAITRAVDQDGETFFLEVEGQRRWVLDQLDGHEHLGIILAERGVPTLTRSKPRLTPWRRGGTAGPR